MAGTIFFSFSKHQSGHLYATFTTSAEMGSDVKSILHVRERERGSAQLLSSPLLEFFVETARHLFVVPVGKMELTVMCFSYLILFKSN